MAEISVGRRFRRGRLSSLVNSFRIPVPTSGTMPPYILRDWLSRWVQCLLFIDTGHSASGHVPWYGKVHYAPFVRASMRQSRNQMRTARAYERWHLDELSGQAKETISRSPRLDNIMCQEGYIYICTAENFMNVSFAENKSDAWGVWIVELIERVRSFTCVWIVNSTIARFAKW